MTAADVKQVLSFRPAGRRRVCSQPTYSDAHTHLNTNQTLPKLENGIQQGNQCMLWPNRELSLRKTTKRKLFGIVALIRD